MNKDLTKGNPQRVLWQFCLPLFGSIVFQQLYNIADSLVAGKFVGENALAAVGNSYEITLIFIAFAFGCNIGCSVIVAQLFGAKKLSEMKTSIYTTFIASAVLCGFLMLLGFACSGFLLKLIHTPSEIFSDSMLYLKIYILGLPFLFFYNVSNGFFSAMGDSKTPFIFLACSSSANILIDILFVKSFHMGVAGVAWATFLCQGISCVLAVCFILKGIHQVQASGPIPVFSFVLLKKIAVIAIPSILQQSFISIGNIVIQSVINGFGPSVIAGYSAAIKLNNLVITSFTTLGNGISNYAAQNLGAGQLIRIRDGLKAGIKIVFSLCVPIVILYLVFSRYLVYIFMTEPQGLAIETGIQFLHIIAPFYFVVSVKLVADGILRGTGMMKQFMAATFTDLILRVILALCLSSFLGTTGIWCAWPFGWCIATILSLSFYRKGIWMHCNKVR